MPDYQIKPGFNIHYLDENPSGQPLVVLLHGLGANGSSWQLQMPDLIRCGYRVIAPDARGFGKSGFPGGRTNIQVMAEDFATLVQHLGCGPVHLVGISMGGAHALQLALDHPALVRSLTLVNTFASLRPKKASLWVYYGIRFVLLHTLGISTQARFVAGKIFPKPEQFLARRELIAQIHQANPSCYRAVMRSFATFNLSARLPEINIPTLIITARQDTTVSPDNQRVLAENIASAHQVMVEDAGHAVIVDQPEVFNRSMLSFLQAH